MSGDLDDELVMMERIGRGDFTRLLYCNSRGPVSSEPTNDALTDAMERAFSTAVRGPSYRGVHICACGERSSNSDYAVADRWMTNSLCVHYLRWHRAEVPAVELNKVRELAGIPVQPVQDAQPGATFLGRPIHEWDPAELQIAVDEGAGSRPPWRSRSAGSRSVGLFQTMPSSYERRATEEFGCALPESLCGRRGPHVHTREQINAARRESPGGCQ